MNSQTHKTNEDRITTERNIDRAFPNHLGFPSNHGAPTTRGTPPFNQRQRHNPAPLTAPNFVPTGMANPGMANYNLPLNNQCFNPNPQPYPHPHHSSAISMPYNYEPNIPAAMNLHLRQSQILADNGRTITAQEKLVQEAFARKATQIMANTVLTKNTIRHELNQSQKPTTSYMASLSKIMTENELRSLMQNKLHIAAGGEPITNDTVQTKPMSDPPNMPAPIIQTDEKNHEHKKTSRQGKESKVSLSDQSLPLNRTEDKKKDKEGIKCHTIGPSKSMTQNKPHSTAAGGEPITNDDTIQNNPARAAAPATTTQSDKNNNEEGKASIQGEESKVKPSDESLPSQSVEKQAKEIKKIKETKNKPPPVSLPPIVVAEVIPSEEKIDKSSVAFAYEIGNKKSEKHKKIKETKIISSQSPPIVVGEAIPLELMENIDKRSVAFAFKIGSKKSERCANAAESKWKSQQSLKCIVTSSHQPANISSSCSTATTHATVSHMNYTPPLEVFNGPAPDLPTGWTLQKLQRTGGATRNRIDRYWYSPTKKKFRSTVEIKKFMTALDMTKGDEEEAFKLFKKGSIVT